MTPQRTAKRISSLSNMLDESRNQHIPFLHDTISHIYIKLDLQHKYENAANADDANGFLRSVARAALAVHEVTEKHGGYLLEVQGSTLHIGLPVAPTALNEQLEQQHLYACIGDVHLALQTVFNRSDSRVEGWRMTVDTGKTLVVSGQGVHGDNSWISLGKSANRPAKHLYSQLELPEEQRKLKRFNVGILDRESGQWLHEELSTFPGTLAETKSIAENIRTMNLTLDYRNVITASAAPIPNGGHPASPSVDRPFTNFGWVMRTDLDGFTKRVEECFDNDQELLNLAIQFHELMTEASNFVESHDMKLVQMPWAGDNFTAAAVFQDKSSYDTAAPKQLVELSLDFEKDMESVAVKSGFDGWAHSVAGGRVHGNANGNIYVAGVSIGSRRFLIGAGEGFGRSTQGFGDINPDDGQIVLYNEDWKQLSEIYKDKFKPILTARGYESSLYRICTTHALLVSRAKEAAKEVSTTISVPQSKPVSVRSQPYFKQQ